MADLDRLSVAFCGIHSDEDIARVVKQFGLTERPLGAGSSGQILGIYDGEVGGATVTLTHRWHDPSQAFAIRPDINKLRLEIAGRESLFVEFEDKLFGA